MDQIVEDQSQSLEELVSSARNAHQERDFERALDLWEKVAKHNVASANGHSQIQAEAHHETARALIELGRFSQAVESYQLAHDQRTQMLGSEHPMTLASLAGYGTALHRSGQPKVAIHPIELALQLRRKHLGEAHADTLASLNQHAAVLHTLGQFEKALEDFEHLHAIQVETLGDDHSETATTLNNIAVTLQALDRLEESLNHSLKANEIQKRVLGTDDFKTIIGVSNIGIVFYRLGRSEEALEYQSQALAGMTRVMGPDHPHTLTLEANVANTLHLLGRFEDAFDHAKTAYDRMLTVLGPDHPVTLTTMSVLGNISYSLNRFDEALEFQQRVADTAGRNLGLEHPTTLAGLSNLAMTQSKLGRREAALESFQVILERRIRQVSDIHPEFLIALNNVGATLAQLDKHEEAIEHMLRFFAGYARQQTGLIGSLDSHDQTENNRRTQSRLQTLFRPLGLLLGFQDERRHNWGRRFTPPAYETWLNFKGSANALENSYAVLYDQRPELRSDLDKLRLLWKQDHDLGIKTPSGTETSEAIRVQKDALGKEIQAHERNLRHQARDFFDLRHITAQKLTEVLAENEVLLDLALVENVLYAFTVTNQNGIEFFVLSEDALTEVLAPLKAWRFAIVQAYSGQRSRLEVDQQNELDAARALYKKLIDPLAPVLTKLEERFGTNTRLTVSADGELYFLPWDALFDGQQLLIERFEIRHIPTPRDLIRLQTTTQPEANSSAVLVGGVDFSTTEITTQIQPSEIQSIDASTEIPSRNIMRAIWRDVSTLTDDSSSAENGFKTDPRAWALPHSKREVQNISSHLNAPIILTGVDANNTRILETLQNATDGIEVFHLATHAAFLTTDQARAMFGDHANSTPQHDPNNPFSRAVVFLAGGYHRAFSSSGPGVLRAWDLAVLNLRGTQLVVLSACDTGTGDAMVGEGVAGLNQALFMAGAQRTLTTLWPVSDRETSSFMDRFYETWRTQGHSPSSALRMTKLQWAKGQSGMNQVCFWAGFVLNGFER
jgi:CHAT domain-containing protein